MVLFNSRFLALGKPKSLEWFSHVCDRVVHLTCSLFNCWGCSPIAISHCRFPLTKERIFYPCWKPKNTSFCAKPNMLSLSFATSSPIPWYLAKGISAGFCPCMFFSNATNLTRVRDVKLYIPGLHRVLCFLVRLLPFFFSLSSIFSLLLPTGRSAKLCVVWTHVNHPVWTRSHPCVLNVCNPRLVSCLHCIFCLPVQLSSIPTPMEQAAISAISKRSDSSEVNK